VGADKVVAQTRGSDTEIALLALNHAEMGRVGSARLFDHIDTPTLLFARTAKHREVLAGS
jgi:hypothetical protein